MAANIAAVSSALHLFAWLKHFFVLPHPEKPDIIAFYDTGAPFTERI